MPLRIDEEDMGDAFRYYLSRQQWQDGYTPPFEQRLDEFVALIVSESVNEEGKHRRG